MATEHPLLQFLRSMGASLGNLPQAAMEDVRRAPQIGREAARYLWENLSGGMMGGAPGELMSADITPQADKLAMAAAWERAKALLGRRPTDASMAALQRLVGPKGPSPQARASLGVGTVESLPAPSLEALRLYRAESPGGEGPYGRGPGNLPRGRYYTPNPNIAEAYREQTPGGRLAYAEVPMAEAAKYRGGQTLGDPRSGYEFLLPESYHQRRLPVPGMPSQPITPFPWEVGAP